MPTPSAPRMRSASTRLRAASAAYTFRRCSRSAPPFSRAVLSWPSSGVTRKVRGVLVRREGMEPEAAEGIARLLDGRSQDVRDAIRVARLTPQLGVERAVELLLGGRV
mgnify:CR=1 FL=1